MHKLLGGVLETKDEWEPLFDFSSYIVGTCKGVFGEQEKQWPRKGRIHTQFQPSDSEILPALARFPIN